MSTTRERGGETGWTCDDCGEQEYSGTLSFQEAWAKLKEDGWTARKVADEWLHRCPECSA